MHRNKKKNKETRHKKTTCKETNCLLNPCKVVAQLLTSQLATVVLTMTHITHPDVMGPSRIIRKEPELHVVHIAFVHSGANYFCLVILSGSGKRSRSRVAQTSARGAQCTDGGNPATVCEFCDEGGSNRTHGRCENDGTVEDETLPRGHESLEARAVHAWQRLRRFNGYAGALDPTYPALLKATRQATTVVTATAPHDQQPPTLLCLLTMLTEKKSAKSREESWKQSI